MSFARNFAMGQQIAQTAMDTYDSSRERRRLREINQAAPTEIPNAYTDQDAEQLRALANVRDAQGKPYYNLEANQDGSYGLKTNFSYAGADGQDVQPGGIATTFAPRQRAMEFMGTRYAPEDLTDSRIEGLRARAMADVVAERDPVRGLAMRQAVKAGERDDTRFGWEQQQQPLRMRTMEQQVRQGDITLGQSERALKVQELTDQVAQMPTEALEQYAAKLNTDESKLPFLMIGQNKDGYKFLTIDPQTGRPLGKEFTVNDAQLRQLAAASVLGMAGYGQESMSMLSAVNKDIADIVAKMNATTAQVVGSENDATSRGRQDGFRERALGIQQQQANQTGAYYRSMAEDRANRANQAAAGEDFQRKIDGVIEGYQAAMAGNNPQAAAIYAREYDQLRAQTPRGLRVPPSLDALNRAQRGEGVTRPEKVEEAGVLYRDPATNSLFATDGLGGRLAVDGSGRTVGVPPQERATRLAQAGVPPDVIPMVRWSNGGDTVLYRGMEFNPNDPVELRALRAYAMRQADNDAEVSMLAGQSNHGISRPRPSANADDNPWAFGPRITFPYNAREE